MTMCVLTFHYIRFAEVVLLDATARLSMKDDTDSLRTFVVAHPCLWLSYVFGFWLKGNILGALSSLLHNNQCNFSPFF